MSAFVVFIAIAGVCFSSKILAQTGVSWEGEWGISPWLIIIFGEHLDLLPSVLQVHPLNECPNWEQGRQSLFSNCFLLKGGDEGA
jgi:hypothetical protein